MNTLFQGNVNSIRQTDDTGLQQFMTTMYNHTAAGLAVSGFTSYMVYTTGLINIFLSGIMLWITMLAPLGMILYYSFKGQDWDVSAITKFYYSFVIVMGIGMSSVFAVFSSTSIVEAFLATALTFGAASAYGYFTKRDLTSWGSFLIVGLIGILIAGLINLFFGSPMISFVISVLGIIIFTGLTAYDSQQAKEIYHATGDPKYGVQFALNLYLNFINLFQMILHLIGTRE